MTPETAVRLINGLVLKPGWTVRPEINDRFEDAVVCHFTYEAPNWDRENAPEYLEQVTGEGARASFSFLLGDVETDEDLYRKVLGAILAIEEHEWREAFRVEPTYWAPFHPHRYDGMVRWGDPTSDLKFGLS